jgi:hypothetical protein
MPDIFIAFAYKDVLYLQAALVTIALCAMAFLRLPVALPRLIRTARGSPLPGRAYVEIFRGPPPDADLHRLLRPLDPGAAAAPAVAVSIP